MPSGRTHDLITILLAAPAFGVGYAVTGEIWSSVVVAVAFIFGGLMFGPDLDTVSKQYSRWSVFRILWWPYRKFFKHRSRFTHGLTLGALIRTVYFIGVVTLCAYILAFAWTGMSDDAVPDVRDFGYAWQSVAHFVKKYLGDNFLILSFGGMWLGGASHSITDLVITYIKTGRVEKFL